MDTNSWELLDDGYTIHFWGNTWKRITINYTVTANTVIEFDYKSDQTEPEIGGIALDNDDSLSADQSWKVYGTQDWGITDYDDYTGASWKHYTIPVGQDVTGSFSYLGLINDFDGGSGSNSYIKNVQIYEDVSEVIVDNDDGAPDYTETGTWDTSGSTGYDGGTYRYATSGQSNTATWDLDLPSAGSWQISVFYRAGSNRTSSTKYVVQTSSGPQTVYINQQTNSLTWVTFGSWSFDSGGGSVELDAAGSSGGDVVIADALKATKQ